MKTIHVPVHFFGRRRIDGVSTYKVGNGAELLTAIGWRVVRPPRAMVSSYTYMLPPPGVELRRGQEPTVSIEVPSDEEIMELATRLHRAGVAWGGSAFGCKVTYTPRHETQFRSSALDGEQPRTESIPSPARFTMTHPSDLWWDRCEWREGDERPPRWFGDVEHEATAATA